MKGDIKRAEKMAGILAGRLVEKPIARQVQWRARYAWGKDRPYTDWGCVGLGGIGKSIADKLDLALSPHQVSWLDSFDSDWTRKVHLAPRGHGKTTIFGLIGILSIIKNNPKSRILIISKTESVASSMLSQITRCARNLIDMDFFPKFSARPSSTKVRFEGNDSKEPSLFATGIDAGITGLHFDWIICDDIIDDINSSTAEQRDKVWEWFAGSLLNLALPQTRILVIGTRKHPEDLYGRLVSNPSWASQVESAVIRYPLNFQQALESGQPIDRFYKFKDGKLKAIEKSDPGEVLWEESWDIDRLLVDRLMMGQTIFDREKQNDIRFFTGRVFKREWINTWKEFPSRDLLSIYIGCDLAISKSDKADSFALAVVGKHNDSWMLLDLVVDKIGFARQAQIIREKTAQWSPLLVGIEDVAYQRALIEHLEQTGGVPVVGVRPVAPKESRIKALQPLFENGKVQVAGYHEIFVRQLVDFPTGKHDDAVDAFEIAVSLGNRGTCLAVDFMDRKGRVDEKGRC